MKTLEEKKKLIKAIEKSKKEAARLDVELTSIELPLSVVENLLKELSDGKTLEELGFEMKELSDFHLTKAP